MTGKLDQIDPALARIGAQLVDTRTVRVGGDEIEQRFYRWGDRLICSSDGIRDGLSVSVSPEGVTQAADPDGWSSIFSFTVPGFDDMNTDQAFGWIVSIPKGSAFPAFLTRHIEALGKR